MTFATIQAIIKKPAFRAMMFLGGSVLLLWLLLYIGLINNFNRELACPGNCPFAYTTQTQATLTPGICAIYQYYEQWQRALCYGAAWPVLWSTGLWLSILSLVCVSSLWLVLVHIQPVNGKLLPTVFLLLGTVLLLSSFATWLLVTLQQRFEFIDIFALRSSTSFAVMRTGFLAVLGLWLGAVLIKGKQIGVFSAAPYRQFVSARWAKAIYFYHYPGCDLPVAVSDSSGAAIAGEPHDMGRDGDGCLLISYQRPQATSGAANSLELIEFDWQQRRTIHAYKLEHSTNARTRIVLDQQSKTVFVGPYPNPTTTNVTARSILSTPVGLIALANRHHNDKLLFGYHSEERKLYYWVNPGQSSREIQEVQITCEHNLSIEAIWYCNATQRLMVVNEFKLEAVKQERLYSGNKRIQVFNEDFSHDYFANSPAGAAGFDKVLDITTVDKPHGVLILHTDAANGYHLALFDGLSTKQPGRLVGELTLPTTHFRPVSLTTDHERNILIVGCCEQDGLVKLLQVSRIPLQTRHRPKFIKAGMYGIHLVFQQVWQRIA